MVNLRRSFFYFLFGVSQCLYGVGKPKYPSVVPTTEKEKMGMAGWGRALEIWDGCSYCTHRAANVTCWENQARPLQKLLPRSLGLFWAASHKLCLLAFSSTDVRAGCGWDLASKHCVRTKHSLMHVLWNNLWKRSGLLSAVVQVRECKKHKAGLQPMVLLSFFLLLFSFSTLKHGNVEIEF